MKEMLKFILAIGVLFFSQVTYSEDITDNYNTGDTLTATTMDNIKSAVNSKQDRVTGICPPGSSIGSINADGTVICETDDDSGGDITDVTAGAGISGGGSNGSVTLSLSGAVSVSSWDFQSKVCPLQAGNGIRFNAGSECEAISVIKIPDGVTLTSFKCAVFDTDSGATSDIRATLHRRPFNFDTFNIFTTNFSDNSGTQEIIGSLVSPSSVLVDNNLYLYEIVVDFRSLASGGQRQLMGCSVSYS